MVEVFLLFKFRLSSINEILNFLHVCLDILMTVKSSQIQFFDLRVHQIARRKNNTTVTQIAFLRTSYTTREQPAVRNVKLMSKNNMIN